jgi:hypothetical protein
VNRLLSLLILVVATPAIADDGFALDIGGLLFGDVYHIPNHHLESGDGATGAVLRRGYLTFDATFGEAWEARLRFEVNQSGEFETYDFEIDVKDLYVARAFGEHEMHVGLSPTITYDLIESVWGLRYLARTPLDMQGVASRDSGIAVRGPVGASGDFSYRAMVGAGIEFGAEAGDGRKFMGALTWQPSANLYVDAYVDHEKLTGPTDRTTAQLFAGYQSPSLRWGVQYSYQDREQDPVLEVAAGFVVKPLSERMSLIGRVDRIIEPSPAGDNIAYIPFDPSAPATMFIGGVEFKLGEHLRVTPNIISTTYGTNDEGVRPDSDLHYRLTVFLDYE